MIQAVIIRRNIEMNISSAVTFLRGALHPAGDLLLLAAPLITGGAAFMLKPPAPFDSKDHATALQRAGNRWTIWRPRKRVAREVEVS